jgi:hypothetical protein
LNHPPRGNHKKCCGWTLALRARNDLFIISRGAAASGGARNKYQVKL